MNTCDMNPFVSFDMDAINDGCSIENHDNIVCDSELKYYQELIRTIFDTLSFNTDENNRYLLLRLYYHLAQKYEDEYYSIKEESKIKKYEYLILNLYVESLVLAERLESHGCSLGVLNITTPLIEYDLGVVASDICLDINTAEKYFYNARLDFNTIGDQIGASRCSERLEALEKLAHLKVGSHCSCIDELKELIEKRG